MGLKGKLTGGTLVLSFTVRTAVLGEGEPRDNKAKTHGGSARGLCHVPLAGGGGGEGLSFFFC